MLFLLQLQIYSFRFHSTKVFIFSYLYTKYFYLYAKNIYICTQKNIISKAYV